MQLVVSGLAKAFGATQALAGAGLELRAGEVHALLGENGSGKSTLAKILAGIHRPDAGEIRVDGAPVAVGDVAEARRLGIAIVFQELSLLPDLSVADNLGLGREAARCLLGPVRRGAERARCAAVLGQLGLDIDPRRLVRRLSMAQKQMVEIAKALLLEPQLLILDEPTSSLTEHEKTQLFGVIRRLRTAGTAILYVTHHLREVLQIADRVSIMRDGRVVVSEPITAETTEDRLLALLVGRRPEPPAADARAAFDEALLSIEAVSTASCPGGVSLSVRRGEIVGLYGVVGCGREAVARALVGLEPRLRGSVALAGAPVAPRTPAQALARGIGFLPSDRAENGILPNRPIRENLNLSRLRELARLAMISRGSERATTEAALGTLGVRYASAELPITTLSGGNQQKVLFGRAVAAAPLLLVLEDATAGIDVGAKRELYVQIRGWAAEGMGFLWLSSDVTETLLLCDRIYAMYDGRIVDELIAPTLADEDRLLSAVLGRRGAAAA
ncbi:MAG TPA: sugar ABC transporter ATP-binding protein [Alphaproteobacteria bacterium]|nr:sugar ABC transporter ATP-binding protein [Alphaproteobacteria bacterium]